MRKQARRCPAVRAIMKLGKVHGEACRCLKSAIRRDWKEETGGAAACNRAASVPQRGVFARGAIRISMVNTGGETERHVACLLDTTDDCA